MASPSVMLEMWGWREQGPRARGARGRMCFPVCRARESETCCCWCHCCLGAMAGPGRFPLVALLLTYCLDTGTSKAELTLWAEHPLALGSPLQLHCAFLGQELITLVSWWRWGQNGSHEELAVIHPTHGAHVHLAHQGQLRVTNVSEAGQVGLTMPSLAPRDNGTHYCCKFSTFPSGVSEQCLPVWITEPAADPSLAPHSALRPEVLGSLGAGAFFLLGSIAVLGHLLQERVRRHRKSVLPHPYPHVASPQEPPMALWVQQGLPVQRTSFSAPYVLINLDYFTSQPSTMAHRGCLPPPLPPRQGWRHSRPTLWVLGQEEQRLGHWHKT